MCLLEAVETFDRSRKDRLTDILDLRVLHDKLVHRNRGDPEKDTGENHGDDSRTPSQDTEEMSISVVEIGPATDANLRERPCLSHDSQTDLVSSE